MNAPSMLRSAEVEDSSILSAWMASLVAWLVESFGARPRASVVRVGPVTGSSGAFVLPRQATHTAGVSLLSVEALDGPLSLTQAPCVSTAKGTDGRINGTWQFLPAAGKFTLVLLVVEG